MDTLTVKQAAVYLGVTEASLRMAIYERRLPSLREGRRVLLRRDALNYYKSRLAARTELKDACARVVANVAPSDVADARTYSLFVLYSQPATTYDQLGDVLGITGERVRQIIEEGLRRL